MKFFKLLCLFIILCCFGCKSEKELKIERITTLSSNIIEDVSFQGLFNKDNLKSLREEISGIPEFVPFDSLLLSMEEYGSADVFAKLMDCPVVIKVTASGPSVVNGWDATAKVTNKSDKTIKYIYFTVVGENAVGDRITCRYDTRCKWTGPLKPGKTSNNGLYWTLYLESQMKRSAFEAEDVEVEFMDGSTWPEHIDHEDISNFLRASYEQCMEAYNKVE